MCAGVTSRGEPGERVHHAVGPDRSNVRSDRVREAREREAQIFPPEIVPTEDTPRELRVKRRSPRSIPLPCPRFAEEPENHAVVADEVRRAVAFAYEGAVLHVVPAVKDDEGRER